MCSAVLAEFARIALKGTNRHFGLLSVVHGFGHVVALYFAVLSFDSGLGGAIMFGLKTLDVGIGMALMFLFVSLICSAVREFGELLLKTRATSLEQGVREMLGQASTTSGAADLTKKLYSHPMIAALYAGSYDEAKPSSIVRFIPAFGRNGLPSYIPAESFARAILQVARDEAAIGTAVALTAGALRNWAGATPIDPLKKAIRTALDSTGDDLTRTQAALEHWFDSTMDRVSGWYKRRTQVWLFVLGLGCAVLMNIDAVTVMKALSTDEALRTQVVGAAGTLLADCAKHSGQCPQARKPDAPGTAIGPSARASAPTAAAPSKPTVAPPPDATGGTAADPAALSESLDRIRSATAEMTQVSWPIGWNDGHPDPQYRLWTSERPLNSAVSPAWWLPIVGGWLITAFGVTFGASFWFDVLNRFMVIRSTIKPDEKSPKEKSKS